MKRKYYLFIFRLCNDKTFKNISAVLQNNKHNIIEDELLFIVYFYLKSAHLKVN